MATEEAMDRRELRDARLGRLGERSQQAVDRRLTTRGVRPPGRGADNADYLEWPTINSRIVAWAQNGVSVVYDRAERRLVTLPVAYDWASGWAGGPNLVWAETSGATDGADHPVSFAVVDTATLAVLP